MKNSGPPARKTPLSPGAKRLARTGPIGRDTDRARAKETERRDRVVAEARSGKVAPKKRVKEKPEAGSADKEPAKRPAPRATGPSPTTRKAVLERDRGRCVRCGGEASNVHHREGRGMGGRKGADSTRVNGMAYLLALCGSGTEGCHGWATSGNLTRARDDGYILRRNALNVPAQDVPVFTHDGWQRFTDDGLRVPAAPPQRSPDA